MVCRCASTGRLPAPLFEPELSELDGWPARPDAVPAADLLKMTPSHCVAFRLRLGCWAPGRLAARGVGMSRVRPHGPRDHVRPRQFSPKKEAGTPGPTTADATIAGTSARVAGKSAPNPESARPETESLEPSDVSEPNVAVPR